MGSLGGVPLKFCAFLLGCTVCATCFAVSAARTSKSGLGGMSNRGGHEHGEEDIKSAPGSVEGYCSKVCPAAIATWRFGELAVEAAKGPLENGATALDAVEAGITAVELDTKDQYFVGLGGLPNADGVMEFDAAVMDGRTMAYGAVLAIRGIATAISAARLVMERSQHSVLVGGGATVFALSNGLRAAETLTDGAREQFVAWRREQSHESGQIQADVGRGGSHDTVGMVCLDEDGNLAAGTFRDEMRNEGTAVIFTALRSTSGWKFKHPGRVGDAPVVGAGLYCDGEVGGAVATGDGEEILRTCLTFLVVEYMRAGDSPALACKKGIGRLEEIVNRPVANPGCDQVARMHDKLTVAVTAMSCTGEIGAASTLGPKNFHRGRPAFPLAIWRKGEAVRVVEETSLPLWSTER